MIAATLVIALASTQPVAARPKPPGPATVAPRCTVAGVGADAFCTASDGTRIHYVSWGGRGPVIVLLAGLGNSARIFDDLGPRLAHGHRVIAITRRGYGLSGDAVKGDYSNARLVRDVLDVMDGLRIASAAFVGHSLAGGELATLGASHPRRATRLVYLDAAYDRSPVPALMAKMPALPPPAASDLADRTAFTRWREGALRVRSPAIAADLVDIMVAGPRGLAPRTASTTAGAILAGDMAAPPRYASIAAPSLAIYTSKDVPEQVPASAPMATRTAMTEYSLREFRPWMLREKARFAAEQRCGTAYELPASGHYFFLERPVWTARTLLRFLDATDACAFRIPPPPEE